MPTPRNARRRGQSAPEAYDPFGFRARARRQTGEGDSVFGSAPSAGRTPEDDDRRRTTRIPLGVPDDYRVAGMKPESFQGMSPRAVEGWSAQGQGPSDLREIGPRYFDGDQYRPGQFSVERIIDMQRRLAIAGFLDLDDIALGQWTGKTVAAYEDLLGYANQVGLDADSALYHAAQSGGGLGGGGGYAIDPQTGELIPASEAFVPPPLEIRTTNKDDLRRVFRQAVTQLLGQGWSQAQIDELVDAYNWKEIAVQKEAYDDEVALMRAELTGELTGGETFMSSSGAREANVPSPETFIETTARERDPAGFQATQIAEEFAPAFFQALGGYV